MSRWVKRNRKTPKGFNEVLAPTLNALEDEMKERMAESGNGKSANEMLWGVHQINWQRTRYVFDMFYVHKRISREVYEYCIRQKFADAGLAAKWKRPGYENLCCLQCIDTTNTAFGTTSICRVPRDQLGDAQKQVRSKFCGCRGCASGKAGHKNIFGNKYGQRLAAIQIRKEKLLEKEKKKKTDEAAARLSATKRVVNKECWDDGAGDTASEADTDSDTDSDDDSDDDDDQGPQLPPSVSSKRPADDSAATSASSPKRPKIDA